MGLLETGERGYYNTGSYGNYQFVSLEDIINQFMIVYIGDGKVINKASRTDVAFFAQRGLAEMSFDTFKCVKSQEVDISASLSMILPQDYVNYTKLSWADSSGVKHPCIQLSIQIILLEKLPPMMVILFLMLMVVLFMVVN